jgi:hypothetical protein
MWGCVPWLPLHLLPGTPPLCSAYDPMPLGCGSAGARAAWRAACRPGWQPPGSPAASPPRRPPPPPPPSPVPRPPAAAAAAPPEPEPCRWSFAVVLATAMLHRPPSGRAPGHRWLGVHGVQVTSGTPGTRAPPLTPEEPHPCHLATGPGLGVTRGKPDSGHAGTIRITIQAGGAWRIAVNPPVPARGTLRGTRQALRKAARETPARQPANSLRGGARAQMPVRAPITLLT